MNKIVTTLLLLIIPGLLFAANEGGEETVEIILQTGSSWNGSVLPEYPEGAPEMTLLRIVIPPGAIIDTHKHPMINVAYVVSGQLTIEASDGREQIVNAGEAVAELVEQWHGGRNDGDEKVVLLVFYAGVEGMALSSRP